MSSKKRFSFTLLLTILVLNVGLWLPPEVQQPTRAQVCGSERACRNSFPNTCLPAPTSIPAININSAGDWFVTADNMDGHCGAKRFLFIFAKACGPPRAERLCTNIEKQFLCP